MWGIGKRGGKTGGWISGASAAYAVIFIYILTMVVMVLSSKEGHYTLMHQVYLIRLYHLLAIPNVSKHSSFNFF